jgi:hypothetical protein
LLLLIDVEEISTREKKGNGRKRRQEGSVKSEQNIRNKMRMERCSVKNANETNSDCNVEVEAKLWHRTCETNKRKKARKTTDYKTA